MTQDDYGDFDELTAPKASKKQHNPHSSRVSERPIELLVATPENLKRKRLSGLVRKMKCANNKAEDDFDAARDLDDILIDELPKPVMIRISDHSTASPGGIQQLQTPFSNNNTMTVDAASTWLGQQAPPSEGKLEKNSPKVPSKWETFDETNGGRNPVAFPDVFEGGHCGYDHGAGVIPNLAGPKREEAVSRPKQKKTTQSKPPSDKFSRLKTKWKKGFEQASLTDTYPSLIEEETSTLTDLSYTDDTGSITDHTDFTSEVSSSGKHFSHRKYLETGELPADTPLIMGVAQDLRLGAQMLLVGGAACLSIAATTATDCQDAPKRRR